MLAGAPVQLSARMCAAMFLPLDHTCLSAPNTALTSLLYECLEGLGRNWRTLPTILITARMDGHTYIHLVSSHRVQD